MGGSLEYCRAETEVTWSNWKTLERLVEKNGLLASLKGGEEKGQEKTLTSQAKEMAPSLKQGPLTLMQAVSNLPVPQYPLRKNGANGGTENPRAVLTV